MQDDDASVKLMDMSSESIQGIVSDPGRISYAGMILPPRPGVAECITALEFAHYPPGTERNDLFLLFIMNWRSTIWSLISIPIDDSSLMEEIAMQCGLRITSGIPTMFDHEGIHQFPVFGPRLFVLQNARDHPVYRNDPVVSRDLFDAEREALERITSRKSKPSSH